MTNYVASVDLLALDHHLKLNTTLEPLKSSLLKEQSSKFLLTTPCTYLPWRPHADLLHSSFLHAESGTLVLLEPRLQWLWPESIKHPREEVLHLDRFSSGYCRIIMVWHLEIWSYIRFLIGKFSENTRRIKLFPH